MKVPFRQQASEYDCVPTTVINALSYLFSRRELPPFIVHRVYKDLMDIESSRGTSSRAIQDLGYLLNNYREKRYEKFVVDSKFIWGAQVHLRQNSKIIRCLDANGAALICVHSNRGSWHYILAFRYDGEWLHCYDPFPRSKRFLVNNDAVKFIETTGHQDPNLFIRCDWLEKDFDKTDHFDERKYVFGGHDDRECLLLNRIQV